MAAAAHARPHGNGVSLVEVEAPHLAALGSRVPAVEVAVDAERVEVASGLVEFGRGAGAGIDAFVAVAVPTVEGAMVRGLPEILARGGINAIHVVSLAAA